MKRLGSPSWSLSVSDEASLDLALYVRDAVGLDTSGDPLAPPPLTHQPLDQSYLLDGTDADAVAEHWAAWWRTSLAFEARSRRRTPGPDSNGWLREQTEDQARTVGEPPGFAALASSPALQRAVVALHEEARRWSASIDRAEVEDGAPYDLVRTAAEEVIARHGVPPDQVNGIVFVIGVDGLWWRTVEPAVVVASASALGDPVTAEGLLRMVFESGLEV